MRLKELRIQKGLSQAQVAKDLGFSAPVYNRYQNGTHEPSVDTIIKISDYFGVSTDYLLGRTDDPYFEYRPAPGKIVLTTKKEDPAEQQPEGIQIAMDIDDMPKTPEELRQFIRKAIAEQRR